MRALKEADRARFFLEFAASAFFVKKNTRTLIEFTIQRRTLSEDQEIHWLETVSGQRGYVAFENGRQEFEMKDNEHVLHNDFHGYDCFGDACRKRRRGNKRRQSARRASDEVRINLLGVCR